MEKEDKKKLVAIVVVSLCIILAVTIYLVFFSSSSDDNDSSQDDSSLVLEASNQILDEFKENLPALESRVLENETDATVRREFAVALYATGDVEGAREHYEKELELNGNDPILHNNLGNVYRDLGKYQEAVDAYQRSLELDPNQFNAYNNLANLLIFTMDDINKGIDVYNRAIENNEGMEERIMLLIASAYEQKGYKEDAIAKYSEVLSVNDQDSVATAALERLSE